MHNDPEQQCSNGQSIVEGTRLANDADMEATNILTKATRMIRQNVILCKTRVSGLVFSGHFEAVTSHQHEIT